MAYIQSNASDKSVSRAPKTLPLSTPFPHRNFEIAFSKYIESCLLIILSKIFQTTGKTLTGR